MRILADQAAAAWTAGRLGIEPEDFGPNTAVFIEGASGVAAGVVFHDFQPRNKSVQISAAAVRNRWLSYGVLCAVFQYVFGVLKCMRAEARTSAGNKKARALAEHLGFRKEGVLRLAWLGEEDALIFGMLRGECRWYPVSEEEAKDGRRAEAADTGRDGRQPAAS